MKKKLFAITGCISAGKSYFTEICSNYGLVQSADEVVKNIYKYDVEFQELLQSLKKKTFQSMI